MVLILCLACPRIHAVSWFPKGPDGGDARTFAADPKDHLHLYLGTADGWIYQSRDGGRNWLRLASVGKRDDLVVDHILVDPADPRHMVAGAWVADDLQHPDGGIFDSRDGGTTWIEQPEMRGQSVRALAIAPSDPKIMVAGSLAGVFRSADSGAHWQQISPPGDKEIHEIESLAIDPADPNTIYAGTWHLPWKTSDGGEHWENIKEGIIEDSDIFSIIIDPKQSDVVYLSACSGIYKSENAGVKFTGGVNLNKAQGIPTTARRTRVLMQDPNHLDTVFAGTTEGLYRTDDGGKVWTQTTGADVIVNDVSVDPADPHNVLLATNRQGVLASHDGGDSFLPSNSGFSARQVMAYSGDRHNPATVYVGVVNDKESGGVFVSHTGGLSWSQLSGGLDGHDVFSLVQAPDGSILAGTERGIYRLQGAVWQRVGDGVDIAGASTAAGKVESAHRAAATGPTTRQAAKGKPRAAAAKSFDASVYGFAVSGETLFAATSQGVLSSPSSGMTWAVVPSIPDDEWRFVAASKGVVAVASLHALEMSIDGGKTWKAVAPPSLARQLTALAADGHGNMWAADRDGVYFTTGLGASWQTLKDLYLRNGNSIYYDEASDRVLVTSNGPVTEAFAVQLPSMQVRWWDTGWKLRFLRYVPKDNGKTESEAPVGDYLLGATLFDGMVVQPRMVDSPEIATPGANAH